VVRKNLAYRKEFDQAILRMWENVLFKIKFINNGLPGLDSKILKKKKNYGYAETFSCNDFQSHILKGY